MRFTLRNLKADLEDVGSNFDGAPGDAVRVPPGAWRGNEAGPEGLEILVIGAPVLGEDPREDVEGQRDWWTDPFVPGRPSPADGVEPTE